MSIVHELTADPARDIVEGRTKLRTVRTVPLREHQLPSASETMGINGEWKSKDNEGEARLVVQLGTKQGWCSTPIFEPPLSAKEFLRRKRAVQVESGASPKFHLSLRQPSEVSGVPQYIVILLRDFLRQFAAPFEVLDFQLFLSREGKELQHKCVLYYLNYCAKSGLLTRSKDAGPFGRVKFQAPYKP